MPLDGHADWSVVCPLKRNTRSIPLHFQSTLQQNWFAAEVVAIAVTRDRRAGETLPFDICATSSRPRALNTITAVSL